MPSDTLPTPLLTGFRHPLPTPCQHPSDTLCHTPPYTPLVSEDPSGEGLRP
jgi:hypothetical protein